MCFGPVVQSCRRICETTLPLALANKKQHNSLDDLSYDTVILERQASCHRRSILVTASAIVTASAVTSLPTPPVAMARLESVNRPDLLPKESGLNVIQTEKFLTSGQARRMNDLLKALERDTGFRVRVLCQNYPNTPGLAIRDYWDLGKEGQKDDKYVVLVVDQFGGRGNVLNFNVGEGLKFALPNIFWTRLSGKYGTVSLRCFSFRGCWSTVVIRTTLMLLVLFVPCTRHFMSGKMV